MLVHYRLGILHPPRMPVAYEGLYMGIPFKKYNHPGC